MYFTDISVLLTFSLDCMVMLCIFFFVAAAMELVHSIFGFVTVSSPDCSPTDDQFFLIGANVQSPRKLVSNDSFISVCLLYVVVQTGVTKKVRKFVFGMGCYLIHEMG
jgi:hypothetical protein